MYKPHAPVVIVAGMEKTTRAIGRENGLLWHVPADMKRFKQLTLDCPIIMGRKTFESIIDILGTPLPNRTNIVISRDPNYCHPGVTTTASLDEALRIADAEAPREIHIGGGSQIYEQSMPIVDHLHLTLFDDPAVVGDTFFPDYTEDFVVTTEHPREIHEGITYQWVDFARK